MSYPVAGHVQFRLRQMADAEGVEFSLRHRVLGFIEDGHREGLTHGWSHLLSSVKQLAE